MNIFNLRILVGPKDFLIRGYLDHLEPVLRLVSITGYKEISTIEDLKAANVAQLASQFLVRQLPRYAALPVENNDPIPRCASDDSRPIVQANRREGPILGPLSLSSKVLGPLMTIDWRIPVSLTCWPQSDAVRRIATASNRIIQYLPESRDRLPLSGLPDGIPIFSFET